TLPPLYRSESRLTAALRGGMAARSKLCSYRERRAFRDGEARTWLQTGLRVLPDPILRPDQGSRAVPEMRHRATSGAAAAAPCERQRGRGKAHQEAGAG